VAVRAGDLWLKIRAISRRISSFHSGMFRAVSKEFAFPASTRGSSFVYLTLGICRWRNEKCKRRGVLTADCRTFSRKQK